MIDLLPEPLRPYSPLFVAAATAVAIFAIGWILSKWTYRMGLRMARRGGVDEAPARFLSAIGRYTVLAVALIAALGKVGIQTTSLVALLGAAGLAVGLALHGNLSHFASGMMLLLFRPFTLGDSVTLGDQAGVVKDIGLFATTIITSGNEKVVLPNSSITSSAIINHTALGTRRAVIKVGVAYGSDLEQVMSVLVEACKSVPTVLEDPAPSAVLAGFGASSVDFDVRPWASIGDFWSMQHGVKVAIYNALDRAGIEIPFDQVVVHRAS